MSTRLGAMKAESHVAEAAAWAGPASYTWSLPEISDIDDSIPRTSVISPLIKIRVFFKTFVHFSQDLWYLSCGKAHLDYVSQIIKAGVWYRRTLFALLLKVPESLLVVEVLIVSIINSHNDLRNGRSNMAYGHENPALGEKFVLNQTHSVCYNWGD